MEIFDDDEGEDDGSNNGIESEDEEEIKNSPVKEAIGDNSHTGTHRSAM